MRDSYKPITNTAWVRVQLCKLQKKCTRLASDKVYQLLAQGRWFSPGTPASSTTKTGRHDIAEILQEILLKVALNTKTKPKTNQIKWKRNTTMSEHDRSLTWLIIVTSIKSGGIKLVLWAQCSLL